VANGVALQFENMQNKMNKLRKQYYLTFMSLEIFAATEFNEISLGRRPDVDEAVWPRKFHWLTFDNVRASYCIYLITH
jgi:hypothetical protein